MHNSGAGLLVETLETNGCAHIFGNPGTTELPFIGEIAASDISYITCLHEDIAVGAAAGYAIRVRQRGVKNPFSVANVHTTPGVGHALGNLYGASFARCPVILTAGCQEPRHERRRPPLSGNRLSLVTNFVKYAEKVERPEEMGESLVGAIRRSLTPPMGPSYLEFTVGAQTDETASTPPMVGSLPSVPCPRQREIKRVSSLLEHGSTTIIVGTELAQTGSEAIQATVELAERLDASVIAEPLSAELGFPTTHEQWRGMLPLSPAKAREWLSTDVLLFIGCTHPEPLLDYEGQLWPQHAKAIWIGHHEQSVPASHSYATTVIGEMTETVHQLAQVVEPRLALDGGRWMSDRSKPAHTEKLAKQQLVEALSTSASDAIIIDEGVTTGFLLRNEGVVDPRRYVSNNSGGLGYGLPAAVGAAIAEDHLSTNPRPVVGLIGDGSYQYYPQTLYTAAQHVSGSLTVVVPDNRGYEILREHETVVEDERGDRPLTFDESISIVKNAESYGIDAWDVTDLSQLRSVLDAAINNPGTDVVVVDLSNGG